MSKSRVIYLLHFDQPYKHARHYLGSTSEELTERMERHRTGRGARLMQVITEAGIGFAIARTWKGTRKQERKMKGHLPRLCPICRQPRKGLRWKGSTAPSGHDTLGTAIPKV